jgi:enoyl-CoA hydratase/carnithine racemase
LSDEIKAEAALRLGLVNRILPSENFIRNCINLTNKFFDAPSSTLMATKRLINFNNSVVEEYFEYESSLLNL